MRESKPWLQAVTQCFALGGLIVWGWNWCLASNYEVHMLEPASSIAFGYLPGEAGPKVLGVLKNSLGGHEGS